MELPLASIAPSIVFVTVVTYAWWILNWIWFRPKRMERLLRQQGLGGNPYRMLVGDMRDFVGMIKEATSKPIGLTDDIVTRVVPFHDQLLKKYGKTCFMWFGPKASVIIMDPEQLREIFNKIYDYERPHDNPLVKLLLSGLESLEGEQWAKRRKIINPAFHIEKLKLMVPEFQKSCSDMIKKWEGLVSKQGGSCELDVWPYLEYLSSDAIARTAFGSNHDEGKTIFNLQRELADLTIRAMHSAYIPGWRFLPTKSNRRMKDIDKEIRVLLTHMINRREKAMKAGVAANNDLLSILMESNFKIIRERGGEKNVGMSTDDVIDECKLFYFAGQETTSSLIVWIMVLLGMHPHWQERAREEVLLVFGSGTPHFDGLSQLKVVNMIVYEVLRLYPPINGITRVVHSETKLGNLVLPAGAQLTLPILLVHHDKDLWGEDALEFKPERFAEGVATATKNRVSFFPFSGGPRTCIGQNFAVIEAKITLAKILQRFSFELSPSYIHAPRSIISLQPQHGAHLILHKLV